MEKYNYMATLVRVVDGDTVELLVQSEQPKDVGFNITTQPILVKETFRLYGINAPESRTRDLEEKKKGKAATRYLELLFRSNESEFRIKTYQDKKGKFGRYLVNIFLGDGSITIADKMVEVGHAVYKDY